jgi:hypothetical protein
VNLPKSRSDAGVQAASGVTAVAGVTVVHWLTICYSNIPAVAGSGGHKSITEFLKH